MTSKRHATCACLMVASLAWLMGSVAHASAERGAVSLHVHYPTLEKLDLAVVGSYVSGESTELEASFLLTPRSADQVACMLLPDGTVTLREGRFSLDGAIVLHRGAATCAVTEFVLMDAPANQAEAYSDSTAIALGLHGLKGGLDRHNGVVTLASRRVVILPGLAHALGHPWLAGASLGRIELVLPADSLPDVSMAHAPAPVAQGGVAGETQGGDMVHCQLYALNQYGRNDDYVGLSVATTSWNLGDVALPWYPIPSENHPFIVMNVYRHTVLGNGATRFEQIGQSWVKHGFCALDNTQCSTDCIPTGCSTLGIGCTDTYSSSLNAVQNGLGPRYEVNPWTRGWVYSGSHLSQGDHGHNHVDHRIQIHDDDLNPLLNPTSSYFVEGFYVCPEDIDQMNSAAWKPVGVVGTPGGIWEFPMTGSGIMPEWGFAIDAWATAEQTLLAQEVPVVEFVSPDGRCILAAEATPIGDGVWHYEYALLNVDMDRKVGRFSLPIAAVTGVMNLGFSGVKSYGEPYSNDPWTATVADGTITFETVDNPLRWGTMYNFWFDATVAPNESTAVTLGLYEQGFVEEVTGTILGPDVIPPDCNGNEIVDVCDIDCGPPEGSCDVPGCGQSLDCNDNNVPDECELDCNDNDVPDDCDIASGTSDDCDDNDVPDDCQMDCNGNEVADTCDIRDGTSLDCNNNLVPDDCEPDCDGNGIPDDCVPPADTDQDGINDCLDLCPTTTPAGACVCPDYVECCWPVLDICLPSYPRLLCIEQDGIPDCFLSPCREGCLIGDWDGDGDLDLSDAARLQTCFSGPDDVIMYVDPSAACFEVFSTLDESDVDIDADETFLFIDTFTGPNGS